MPYIHFGQHVQVSEIMEVLKKHNVKPEEASLEAEGFEEYNSYGDKYIEKSLTLHIPEKTK